MEIGLWWFGILETKTHRIPPDISLKEFVKLYKLPLLLSFTREGESFFFLILAINIMEDGKIIVDWLQPVKSYPKVVYGLTKITYHNEKEIFEVLDGFSLPNMV